MKHKWNSSDLSSRFPERRTGVRRTAVISLSVILLSIALFLIPGVRSRVIADDEPQKGDDYNLTESAVQQIQALIAEKESRTPAQQKIDSKEEMDRVQAMISQAKTDAEKFSKSGGKPSDPSNPNLKWSAALWQYRETHPGTPATVIATIEALRLLNRADRLSEVQAKADTLKPDDPAWKQVLYVLMSAASKSKDYNYLISKAEALAQRAIDPEIKAQARFFIGDAYWKTKDIDRARKAFQAVVAEYPQTRYGQEAEGNLWEIEHLNPGQPAPGFERTTLTGDPISLAGFKGKVVVLKFWGTY